MTSLDTATPVRCDDAEPATPDHTTANPAATRAAQAFVNSPLMKVLAEQHQTRAAKPAAR